MEKRLADDCFLTFKFPSWIPYDSENEPVTLMAAHCANHETIVAAVSSRSDESCP